MRIGFALPQHGNLATPETLGTFADRAETLGAASVWVSERLLWPVEPKAPYPGSADGKLPENVQSQLNPLECLAFVAARTQRVALGTSVINVPFHQPLLLARSLATIDVLSRGRLRVGLGNGWLPDEFEAVGVSMQDRGRRIDEYLAALKQIWTENPVEFAGQYCQIPKSVIGLKPVQKPHPPVYMAAFTKPAMQRVARYADGWNPATLPVEAMGEMFRAIKTMAQELGRDPESLALIVRANIALSAASIAGQRPIFVGSREQLRADIEATRRLGADELIFDATWSPGIDSLSAAIECMEELWTLATAE